MSPGSGQASVTEEAVAVSSPAAAAKPATQPLGPSAPRYDFLNGYILIQDIYHSDASIKRTH